MTLEQLERPVETRSQPGRPLRADAERNRLRILVAAAEVFARRGLEAGLDEIARHAGVGTATVYRRFPDKAMLIEALFESRLDDLLELAREALATTDPWDGLVHFMQGSVEMQLADRGLKDLLFGDGCARSSATARFAGKIELLEPTFSAIVARAKAAGRLREDVGVTDLSVVQFMMCKVGAFSADVAPQLWRRQFGLILDGLRADRALAPLLDDPLTLEQLQGICGSP